MKKIILILLVLSCFKRATAQDDLLNMLEKETPQKPIPVYATFKATRVITGQSIEQLSARHLNFVILHRFGEINQGAYELWGLDQANMRLALDYGVTNRIQIGAARTTLGKTYDGNIKIKILKQSRGEGGSPLSIGYYGNIGINSEHWSDPTRNNYFSSRLSFFNQIIFARKFNEKFSLQIAPCLSHQNLVPYTTDQNTIFAIGTGASLRLNKSFRLNFEYYPRLNGRDMKNAAGDLYVDYLGLGVDIETGGHVFQLMLCNGVGMLEQQMVSGTTTSWKNAGIRMGFNISRTFSFDHSSEQKKW